MNNYYTIHEAEQFVFYRIPKALITDKIFSMVSTDAKLLYGLLLDRMGLSAKNGWCDESGRVYIYYTVDAVREDLSCGKEKACKTSRSIWLAERQGLDTCYNLMRRDIDDAISRSFVPKYFYGELRSRGYIVRYDERRKYATIQIPGTEHPIRFKTLGKEYTQERIEQRLMDNRNPLPRYHLPPKLPFFRVKHSSLYALYLHYCDLLHIVKENRSHPYYSAALRSDLRKLDALSAQTRLLCNHQIDTAEQLQAFIDRTKAELGTLSKERNRVYTQITRCANEGRLPELIAQRDALTKKITTRRRDSKNANEIMQRSEIMREKVKALEPPERIPDHSR